MEEVEGISVPETIVNDFQVAIGKATDKLSKYIHEDKTTAHRYIRLAIAALFAAGALILGAVWTEDISKEIISKIFKAALAIWESA